MNEFQKIRSLSAKIEQLLESANRSGKFSVIDKDLLTNYVRELYELIVAIQPGRIESRPIEETEERKPKREQPKVQVEEEEEDNENYTEEQPAEEPPRQKKNDTPKKSITEIYSQRDGNGKVTVNEKFKRQGLEVADRLKQTPIKDLKAYIGLNKRFTFINTLFNGDEKRYEETITRVNEFKSYEEAAGYIQNNVLQSFEWKNDEPLVDEFFTLLMRRYLN